MRALIGELRPTTFSLESYLINLDLTVALSYCILQVTSRHRLDIVEPVSGGGQRGAINMDENETLSPYNAKTPRKNTGLQTLDEALPLLQSGGELPRGTSLGGASTSLTQSRLHKFSNSLRQFRSANLTMSLLEKPSDDRRNNAWLAGWNVTNLIQGTGIMGVPYAVQQGGWAALAMTILVAWICCFTGKVLVDCLYEESSRSGVKKRVRMNYPEVGEAVWPGWGYKVVSVVQVCEMFGGTVLYIVLLGTVFNDILSEIAPLDIYKWCLICTCTVMPLVFIKRMSLIAWFSMVSVFALLSSILTILIYCLTEYKHWRLSNIPPFDPVKFPVGFGIIVFSYTAHAIFPGVEASMKEPQKYPLMMNWSFAIAAVVKFALGIMAVLLFGKKTEQVVTVNMKENFDFSTAASVLVIINVALAFPLVSYVVIDTWDNIMLPYFSFYDNESGRFWLWLLLSRPLIITSTLLVGVVVPQFGLIMGLVGSFTGTCLCFLFPCYFQMKLQWKKLKWYDVVLRVIIIVFGLIAGVLGMIFSAKAIVVAFSI